MAVNAAFGWKYRTYTLFHKKMLGLCQKNRYNKKSGGRFYETQIFLF